MIALTRIAFTAIAFFRFCRMPSPSVSLSSSLAAVSVWPRSSFLLLVLVHLHQTNLLWKRLWILEETVHERLRMTQMSLFQQLSFRQSAITSVAYFSVSSFCVDFRACHRLPGEDDDSAKRRYLQLRFSWHWVNEASVCRAVPDAGFWFTVDARQWTAVRVEGPGGLQYVDAEISHYSRRLPHRHGDP